MRNYLQKVNPLPSKAIPLKDNYHQQMEVTMEHDEHILFKIKPRILLVEDTPILQLVFTKLLEILNCEVVLAKNGFEAVEMFNDGYALILLDLGLPGMDGIKTAMTLRTKDQAKRIPIIGMTACDEQMKSECTNAGIDDLFIKPVILDTLKQILQRWLIP